MKQRRAVPETSADSGSNEEGAQAKQESFVKSCPGRAGHQLSLPDDATPPGLEPDQRTLFVGGRVARRVAGRRRHVALLHLGEVPDRPLSGKSAVASAYGAAGSLVIIVVWVHYSAQILLFGAEFTKVGTKRRD